MRPLGRPASRRGRPRGMPATACTGEGAVRGVRALFPLAPACMAVKTRFGVRGAEAVAELNPPTSPPLVGVAGAPPREEGDRAPTSVRAEPATGDMGGMARRGGRSLWIGLRCAPRPPAPASLRPLDLPVAPPSSSSAPSPPMRRCAVREAAEVVSRVAAVAPDHECVVTVLATALEADGRWDDARQTLQRGLARFEAQGLHAAVPGVLLELGTVAVHGNDLQTAYQLFRCVCGGRGWRCTRWRQRVADVDCVSCWVGPGAEK